jgi:outer membrane immunogenic protein
MGRFMNKFVLAVFTLAVSAVGASAADLAGRPYTKAPAAVAAAYDWSGFYIGANGGGQIGYRWQRATWVFGLEAQGQLG